MLLICYWYNCYNYKQCNLYNYHFKKTFANIIESTCSFTIIFLKKINKNKTRDIKLYREEYAPFKC